MFRRFMIVCWALFSLCILAALVGWAGYVHYGDKANEFAAAHKFGSTIGTGSEAIQERLRPERLELNRLWKAQREFQDVGGAGIGFAASILLWNLSCYAAHKKWPDSRPLNRVKENWRAYLVLAAVVWAVISYAPLMDELESEYALPAIFGPLIIAVAIHVLFPKAK